MWLLLRARAILITLFTCLLPSSGASGGGGACGTMAPGMVFHNEHDAEGKLLECGDPDRHDGLVATTAAGEADDQDHAGMMAKRQAAAASKAAGQRDPMGRTPLHVAAHRADWPIVESLLAGRADHTARDKASQTPLHLAAERGHLEVVRALFSWGVALEAVDDRRRTALHLAAYRGHGAIIEDLVARSAVVDAFDHGGHTPLMLASRLGHFTAMLALVGGRADVHRADRDGRTALHEAATARHALATQLLLEARVAPADKDRWGRTAMHDAARSGAHEAAHMLLAYGASANVRAPDAANAQSGPVTPKMDAKQFNREEASAVLESEPPYCAEKKLLAAAGAGSGGVVELLGKLFQRSPTEDVCTHTVADDEEDQDLVNEQDQDQDHSCGR